MPLENFGNNSSTTLAAAINNAVTSITVTGIVNFPTTGQFRIRIDNEIMLVTAGLGTTTWTVTRPVESTVAASHVIGSVVYGILTSGALLQLKADAIGTIGGTPPVSVTDGLITIPDGTSDQKGLLTTAFAALLTNATSASVANSLVQRDANNDSYFRQIGMSGMSTLVGGTPSRIVGTNGADTILRAYNPLNMTVGAINGQANSATTVASTAANANQIALRDGSGNITATNFSMVADEGRAENPFRVFGRTSSSNLLRTFNPGNMSVNYANSSGTAGTAANATNWSGHDIVASGTWTLNAGQTGVFTHNLGIRPKLVTAYFSTAVEGGASLQTHACSFGVNGVSGEVTVTTVNTTTITFYNGRSDTVYIQFNLLY